MKNKGMVPLDTFLNFVNFTLPTPKLRENYENKEVSNIFGT